MKPQRLTPIIFIREIFPVFLNPVLICLICGFDFFNKIFVSIYLTENEEIN